MPIAAQPRSAKRASALQLAGDRERAQDSLMQGLALAESLDHPNTLAHALHNLGISLQLAGDRDAAFRTADRAAALAEKFGLSRWRAGSLLIAAWATAVGSGVADAARLFDAEIGDAKARGPLPQYLLGLAAEVLLAAGRPADGLTHLDRALSGVDEPGVGFYLPEIYRLRGECLLALGRDNKDEARSAFTTACNIAKQQGAVILERRAAVSLSGLATSG
jgi:tetratricopeptide (TPR) repeat protein